VEGDGGGDRDDAELVVGHCHGSVADERADTGKRVGPDRIGGWTPPPAAGSRERSSCQKCSCDNSDAAEVDGPLEGSVVELERGFDTTHELSADGGIDERRHPSSVTGDGACEEQARATLEHA
jgi:hypothetical protein